MSIILFLKNVCSLFISYAASKLVVIIDVYCPPTLAHVTTTEEWRNPVSKMLHHV